MLQDGDLRWYGKVDETEITGFHTIRGEIGWREEIGGCWGDKLEVHGMWGKALDKQGRIQMRGLGRLPGPFKKGAVWLCMEDSDKTGLGEEDV